MSRRSNYGSLVPASLEWCEPSTVVYSEWVCKMRCEVVVALSGRVHRYKDRVSSNSEVIL